MYYILQVINYMLNKTIRTTMVNILTLSDIHLGHKKNKTEDIILNLRRYFKRYHSQIVKCDLILITGDTFDKLLSANSSDYISSLKWLSELLVYCKDYSIKLRILEGTPSHDWKQVKSLYEIIGKLNIDVDFKYYEELDIEYIEDLGINILYVPDEWKPTPSAIYKDVLEKLKEKKLTKVDIAAMHGAFSFQLPDFIQHTLNPADYLNVVDGPILIGHVHIRSVYKRIIVPGSFDNLTHSDDGLEKGGVFIKYDVDSKKFTFDYKLNKHALKFTTIDMGNGDIDVVVKRLSKYSKTENMFVRIMVDVGNRIIENKLELRTMFPNLNIDISENKVRDNHDTNKVTDINIPVVSIDRAGIVEYISKNTNDEDRGGVLLMLEELL